MLINFVIIASLLFIFWLIVKWLFQVVKVSVKTGFFIGVIVFTLVVIFDVDMEKIWQTTIQLTNFFRGLIN